MFENNGRGKKRAALIVISYVLNHFMPDVSRAEQERLVWDELVDGHAFGVDEGYAFMRAASKVWLEAYKKMNVGITPGTAWEQTFNSPDIHALVAGLPPVPEEFSLVTCAAFRSAVERRAAALDISGVS